MSVMTWNIVIKNKAWRNIMPIGMSVVEETTEEVTWEFLFIKKVKKIKTGNFGVLLTYTKPYSGGGQSFRDFVLCDSKEEAQQWFDKTAPAVFLNNDPKDVIIKPPPKPPFPPKNTKNSHLKLL